MSQALMRKRLGDSARESVMEVFMKSDGTTGLVAEREDCLKKQGARLE
jgi:hypothetical protein